MYVVGFNYKKGLKIKLNEFSDHKALEGKEYETRYPGEAIPEVESWSEHVLNSHLRLKWVQTKADYDLDKARLESQVTKARSRANDPAFKKPEPPSPVEEEVVEEDLLPEVEVSVETVADKPLKSFSKSELMKLCKERGLTVRGTKQELLERLGA